VRGEWPSLLQSFLPETRRVRQHGVETGKYIEDIPHRAEFERWRSRLSETDSQAICAALNERADDAAAGSQVLTAGWIPGNDWAGTVYEPIYQNACDQNARGGPLLRPLRVGRASAAYRGRVGLWPI